MPFQLHIRQNLDAARDHFGPGQVRRFDEAPVRIGSGPACECRLEAPEFAPCHLWVEAVPGPEPRYRVRPQDEAPTYLHGEPLTAPSLLRSGDELRVGHWTLRFQNLHAAAARSRPFSLMSGLAKGCLAAILCAEVAMVLWLPRRLHQAAVWQTEISRQRVIDLLDRLRRETRDTRTDSDFARALRQEIDRELRQRSDYVKQHGGSMAAEQTRLLYEELTGFERLLLALQDGTLPPALPPVDLEGGVRALLEDRHGR